MTASNCLFRYRLSLDLFGEIVPDLSKYTVRQTKIEIKLKKADASANWSGLTRPTAVAPATARPEGGTVWHPTFGPCTSRCPFIHYVVLRTMC